MKTLLVPVDFTPTSENAINFAAEWSIKYCYERIILLKTFYSSMYENLIMSAEYANVNQEYLNKTRAGEIEQLNILCRGLDKKTGNNIKVQTAVSELPLLRSIIEMIRYEKPEMILLGSDTVNHLNEAFIAGNVISIAKLSPVRVLIVPANYTYRPVYEALVPCDFNAIGTLNKINSLRTAPQWHDVHITVLNVDAKQRYANPDERFREAENSLHNYLKNFRHEIHYVPDKNVINGILNFKKINEVQLMIALPGPYSFLYSLTHKSISEALYRNARLPVMILK